MVEPIFIGSDAKLVRAAKFIDELEVLFVEFNNDEPFSARFDLTVAHPSIVIDWKGIGYEAGAILGDGVHNLRAALDLMASELARINGKSDRNVYFPFAASVAEFQEQVRKRNFDKAGADAVQLLHTFAPYRGGNELLRAIHDLDIEDKHTALLETHKTIDFEIEGIFDIGAPQVSKLSLNASLIQHHFGDQSPLEGKLVIETLRDLAREVSRVVDAFRELVHRRTDISSTGVD